MTRALANPHRVRRGGYVLALLGALAGCLGTIFRDRTDAGSWTFLLDTAGWAAAAVAAVAEARVATILAPFASDGVRRRATVLLVLGVAAAVLGCVLLSVVASGGTIVVRAASAALLIIGVWLGLAGLLSLALTIGARYAADRLATLDDD